MEACGQGVSIAGRIRVSGGDINDACILKLSDGHKVFLKENTRANSGFFHAESQGLEAIRATRTIAVPEVLLYGTYGDRSFLIMECLEPGQRRGSFWEDFGHSLSEMHKREFLIDNNNCYGFMEDNYIGAGKQINTPSGSWVDFFRDMRLRPQFEWAKDKLKREDAERMDYLLAHLDRYIAEPAKPSLLHGDLWSGNFVLGPDGRAWLIDPAAYVGAAEADIAMTELFGGFAPEFYSAYREGGLIEPEYGERRNIYNLYHMLNHLNLFGGSYLYSVRRMLDALF